LESAVPPSSRPVFRFVTLGVLAAAFLLAGCGRKGPLDPPPGSSMQQPPANVQSDTGDTSTQPNAQSTEFGQDGKPIAPRGQKKRLPADVLID
jgi:predicted small lipoprotein YifL